jgi:hypothetical protein
MPFAVARCVAGNPDFALRPPCLAALLASGSLPQAASGQECQRGRGAWSAAEAEGGMGGSAAVWGCGGSPLPRGRRVASDGGCGARRNHISDGKNPVKKGR